MNNRKIWFSIVAILFSFVTLTAQAKHKLEGKVIDSESGELLRGATVQLIGTHRGALTNMKGEFTIKDLEKGQYNIKITYIGYSDKEIANINIHSNHNLGEIDLKQEETLGAEVVVTAERILDNQAALLSARKKAIQLSDAISSDEIKKTPDSDAGQALKRVSGVTLVSNKFVYIRGVSERYNNTTLNGASLASTEPDKKAFAFDMFPAEFIENANVAKSFTPDLPGNFVGGLVQLNTIDFPQGYSLRFSTGASVSDNLLFQDKFISTQGGSLDWLGFDDGTRALPNVLPATPSDFKQMSNQLKSGNETDIRQAQGQWLAMNNSFNTKQWKRDSTGGRPNGNFTLAYTDLFKFSDDEALGVMASAMYGNSYSLNNIQRGTLQSDGTTYNYFANGDQMTFSTNLGLLLNLAYRPKATNSISLKNTYNNSADDETTIISGHKEQNELMQYAYQFVQKTLFASQLSGSHLMQDMMNSTLNWKLGYSLSRRDEPDFRRVRYSRNDPSEPFRVDIYDMNGNGYQAGRFFSQLNENAYNTSVDMTIPLQDASIKFGGLYEAKDRDFLVRSFTIVKSTFAVPYYYDEEYGYMMKNDGDEDFYESAFTMSPDELFSAENFGIDRLGYGEETKASDSYRAKEGLLAGYVMGDFPLSIGRNKLNVVAGLRLEHSTQMLNSYYPIAINNSDSIFVDRNILDFLPTLNLNYEVNKSMNLRFAASQTLTRPSLREYAPFTFYDFQFQGDISGNPELTRALIQNFDLRWEWFLAPNEVLSVSTFYKKFTNAIEETIIPTSSNFKKTYTNAHGEAYNCGIEFEFRKGLGFISHHLDNFLFNANLALIESEIEVMQVNKLDKRQMWGQSPYTLNLGLFYANPLSGTSVNLSYNTFGKRIIQVADIQRFSFDNPHIYELPRNMIDLSISQKVFDKLDIKLVIKDLLNEKSIWQQNGKLISGNTHGRTFSLGASYKF